MALGVQATTLLEFNADPNDADPASGMTPLHYACSLSMRDVMSPPLSSSSSRGHGTRSSPHPRRRASSLLFVNLLLGAGASVNAIDLTGRSPLFFALTLPTLQAPGRETIPPSTPQRSVSANRPRDDWESVTAMTAAPWDDERAHQRVRQGEEDGEEPHGGTTMPRRREALPPGPSALFDAPSSRAVVASLLRAGADVNVRDHTGVSPLRWLDLQVRVLRRSLWQCQGSSDTMGVAAGDSEPPPTLRVSLVHEVQQSVSDRHDDADDDEDDEDDDEVLAWSDDSGSSEHSATEPEPSVSAVALATAASDADDDEDFVMDDSEGEDGHPSEDMIYHGRADSARSFVEMANAMLSHAQSLRAMLVQAGATLAGHVSGPADEDSKESEGNGRKADDDSRAEDHRGCAAAAESPPDAPVSVGGKQAQPPQAEQVVTDKDEPRMSKPQGPKVVGPPGVSVDEEHTRPWAKDMHRPPLRVSLEPPTVSENEPKQEEENNKSCCTIA